MQLPAFFPVTCHTDFVGPHSIFVVINGFNRNGAQFIPKALEKGATTFVIEKTQDISEYHVLLAAHNATVIRVENARKSLAQLAAEAAGLPAQKLQCIGITGTKGKTTTSWLCYHILKSAGYKTALISTVANVIGDTVLKASLTTPQPDYLHQFLKLCVQEEITHVVMEVAAQALSMHRVEGILFDAVAFTNFGLEHLEFYSTLENYFEAKAAILSYRKPDAPAFMNADDQKIAAIQGKNLHLLTLNVMPFQSPEQLPGMYNRYNCMFASYLARAMGVDDLSIQKALNTFPGIPGRMEKHYLSNGALAIIDYAHNPMSYEALLSYLRLQTDHLIVLFGAGGERDASRRPLMGAVAHQYADVVILTSDNPRSENPYAIIEDIKKGIPSTTHVLIHEECDREKAIQYAYQISTRGSIIALLGKGPDEYQIIGASVMPFSERSILAQLSQ